MRGRFVIGLSASWVQASLALSTLALGIGLTLAACGSQGTAGSEPSPTPDVPLADGGSSGSDQDASGSSGSSGSSGTSGGPCTTAASVTGTLGATGGSVSRLVFAVVGDTRPANEDDVGGYPTSIITKIYQDIEAQTPHPALVLGTGDYQFSSTRSSGTGAAQVALYMDTRKAYTGPFFPAMGNHECGVSGGFTTSDNANCGPGNQGGATLNYNAFINQMLAPISQPKPYYSVNVNATDKSWTAKFVITAANAWDTAQQTWLDSTLAVKTTYTFVVRHQTSDATPPLPPGVAGVDAVLAKYPYTLLLCGHAHTYGHYRDTPQSVTLGNGGAPLSSKNYGYGIFSQRCDGAIVADEFDYQSGATDSQFHFVITPAGTITK